MAPETPLFIGDSSQGRVLGILAWEDHLVYLRGAEDKMLSAISSGARTAEDLMQCGLGTRAFARDCPVTSITKFTFKESPQYVAVQYLTDDGETKTIDALSENQERGERFAERLGIALSNRGLTKSVRNVSALSVFFSVPVFSAILVSLIGISLTVVQAVSGGEPDLASNLGNGRSARRAKGIAALLFAISNLIGTWGCLLLTSGLVVATGLFLRSKLKRRPTVVLFE